MSQMPLPKYHQIYLVLREQLEEGRFAEGVPGELALMAQFGVARVTIRRALGQLSSEGLISRNPGRRTRPVAPKPSSEARAAEMLFDGIEGRALSSFTVVLRPELVVRESTRDLAGAH